MTLLIGFGLFMFGWFAGAAFMLFKLGFKREQAEARELFGDNWGSK
jgi:hypothetical protein